MFPKIIDKLESIKAECMQENRQPVFLITGKHFLRQRDLSFLEGLDYTHYIKQGPNVDIAEADLVFQQYLQSNCKALLAIGGGSVMDLAKTIVYNCVETGRDIPFFIAAPTTAGSGSEATHFAVVYTGNKKHSLVHETLLPKIAVLDPRLCYSLDSYQLAASGMDVLAQGVESYWNLHATEQSRSNAAKAIALWQQNFLPAVTNDKDAIAKMLCASHAAGKAISITRTTGPHALSYFLSSRFGVPHGHAVGILLPVFYQYNNPEDAVVLLGRADSASASHHIRDTMKKAGLAISLEELGIDKHDLVDEWLHEVNEERFANNPVPFNRERLKQLLLTSL